MTEDQIWDMLREIVEEIDADIYKSYFETDPDSDEWVDGEPLFDIVVRHMNGDSE